MWNFLAGLCLAYFTLLSVMILIQSPTRVFGILYSDQLFRVELIIYSSILYRSFLTCQQIMVKLWLFIELKEGGVRIDITGLPHCNDVGVGRELLVGNGTVVLSLLVPMKV